jgi:hypothetical protein
MYGANCHVVDCCFNVGKLGMHSRCSNTKKEAFMICERPSRMQTDNILRRLSGGSPDPKTAS